MLILRIAGAVTLVAVVLMIVLLRRREAQTPQPGPLGAA
jgi:hypothetical protein